MVKYPELAKIMAITGMFKKDLARIIGKAPSAVTQKLDGRREFKLSEMKAIVEYFSNNEELIRSYPVISMDIIFSGGAHNAKQSSIFQERIHIVRNPEK